MLYSRLGHGPAEEWFANEEALANTMWLSQKYWKGVRAFREKYGIWPGLVLGWRDGVPYGRICD